MTARLGRVNEVVYLVHVFEGKWNMHNPQAIYLELSSGISFTLRCGADGESLQIAHGKVAMAERDMGELGQERLVNATRRGGWENISGQDIDFLGVIKGQYAIEGIVFQSSQSELFVMNRGDELVIYNQAPQNILSEEGLTVSPLDGASSSPD
ncbi:MULTISPECIES: hypothetical protein [unclassified Rhizobium]|uniref:hypothetical protein n=1 Tax=unclassified Rhizobium TaxID=2613769 RepID=UPI001C8389BB|nr:MULTISPECIES: hypothetical protein [unclassified Rhizobium]MBX5217826.1 hypothetical protein [Rhizobium sp. NLR9a]MBX5221627.1 hypothetical protein [Rhizobium sp. NLR8a]MBX5244862.1 hypothetical protein [Rhizobium sp. NLR3b]MBX5276687.1 hypothetical protein [Rhizobium sp. NLR13a]MBX5282445.1 hypothetical protein [Rhizobium sp. NLR10a]